MAMTAAEQALRYRKRRDEDTERRKKYLLKERLRYIHLKSIGRRKLVSEMSYKERKRQRRVWRKHQKRHMRKLKKLRKHQTVTCTPPLSKEKDQPLTSRGLSQQNNTQRSNGKPLNRRVYRENVLLKEELRIAKTKTELYRKRWIREIEKYRIKQLEDTPKTKSKKLLRCFSSSKSTKTVRKTLEFHNSLVAELSQQYKTGDNCDKRTVSKIVTGKTMKRYNLICHARKEIGVSNKHGDRIKRQSLTRRLKERIKQFFERDDISRIVPGMKKTITKNKQKKQKRVLNDNLVNIHRIFLNENKDVNISYTSFCRQRPFWVVQPRESDRETCACRIHENFALLVDALDKKQLLPTNKPSLLANLSVCDIKNKDCMYGDCENCKNRELIQQKYDETEKIIYQQWQTKVENREIKKEVKQVTITSIVHIDSTLGDLIGNFESQMIRFKVHLYNIANQNEYYKTLQKTLEEDEVLIHIDFAENYVCKSQKEIQESRFGASRRQMTIHTGIYYTSTTDKPVSFATVSDSLQHGPAGIWAFLNPVLQEIKNVHPSIDKIHFFSDGPFNQYRQKNNFYLFSTELAAKGFAFASWNFHEAGHGKGAPDGVGGSLKRAADMRVLHGGTIDSAKSFVIELKKTDSSVALYQVSQEDVDRKEKALPPLKTVPGTSKLHQMITYSPGQLLYRDVSCSCSKDNPHIGHEFKEFNFCSSSGKDKGGICKERVKCITSEDKPPNRNGNDENAKRAGQEKSRKSKDRKEFYKESLKTIGTCKTFRSLVKTCEKINTIQNARYKMDTTSRNPGSSLSIDEVAMDQLPHDFENSHSLHAISVLGDGNCLPYSASVIAFGNQDHGEEMRVRIVIEQALNKLTYLSEPHLQKGLGCQSSKSISKTYAMFSEEYTPGIDQLDKKNIEEIYEKETLHITRPGSFMGMWQLCALSSILGRRVVSVHPKRGNLNIRNDLHRTIEPRTYSFSQKDCAYIMWTSARKDMRKGHWQANHFVPLLAFPREHNSEKSEKATPNLEVEIQKIILQRLTLIDSRKKKARHN